MSATDSKEKKDSVRIFGSVFLFIFALGILFFNRETWSCIDWITFVSSFLAIEGLVLAWTELKGNAKVMEGLRKEIVNRQIVEEKGYLASELTQILSFASNQNYDKAHITFVFVRQRLLNAIPDHKGDVDLVEKKLLKNRNANVGIAPAEQTKICNMLISIRSFIENLKGE